MPRDYTTNAGAGGKTFHSYLDGSGVDWPAGVCAYLLAAGTPDSLQAVDATHGLPVQPQTGATFPISATALPLPAGAAQEHATAASPHAARLTDGAAFYAAPATGQFPAALSAGGNLKVSLQESNASQAVTGSVSVSSLPNTTNAGQTAVTADYDTGAGVVTQTLFGLALPAPGGPVAGGTATNPVRTDPVGTTTQPVSLASLPALVAGTAIVGKVTTDQTTHGTTDLVAADITKVAGAAIAQGHGTAATAVRVELPTDGTGVVGLIAGAAIVGKVGIDQTTPGTTNGVTQVPATSGGCTPYYYRSSGAANQDSAAAKGSAGQLYGYQVFNSTASIKYVKLYDKASGATSSDTPKKVIMLPASGGANMPLGDSGVAFASGICHRITTGSADNDTGAVAAGDVIVNLDYK